MMSRPETLPQSVSEAFQPVAQTSPERLPLAASAPCRVTLVVEYYPGLSLIQPDGVALWGDLSRLLNPATTRLNLVHAVSEAYSADLPKMDDVEQIRAAVQSREITLAESKIHVRQWLEAAQFQIDAEQTLPLQEASAKSLVSSLSDADHELLVVISLNRTAGDFPSQQHFAIALATRATVSTLILKRPLLTTDTKLRILLGVDPSDASLTAARKLADFIRTDAVSIQVVTVQSPMYQENAVLAPYVNQTVLEEAQHANAQLTFEMMNDVLETRDLCANSMKAIIGSPATELGFLAESEHPDLLVVGSHNRKGFLAWFMGSVSSQLLHWDTHNLLIIR
jgi:nucleotide-binding universal stress UspA family protein